MVILNFKVINKLQIYPKVTQLFRQTNWDIPVFCLSSTPAGSSIPVWPYPNPFPKPAGQHLLTLI